ncbi:MAG: cellulose binding domain-containing protein [Clostridiales bacterium]
MFKVSSYKIFLSIIIVIAVIFSLSIAFIANVHGAGSVSYDIANDWGSGAVINLTVINNDSTPMDNWTVTWTFPGNQKITSMWNGNYTQNGSSVTVKGVTWNSTINPNSSISFGFQLTYSGTNNVPSDIALNGTTSTSQPTTSQPTTSQPTTSQPTTSQPANGQPDGYAGSSGTTGGGNSSSVTVSSASAFKSAVSGSNSKVVIVNGNLNLGGNVTIGSNTTLKGANSNSGLYGGSIIIQGTNYIVQNLNFGPSSGDVMEISGATKVYITKCAFHDSTDELCSIVRASDYVTVSWCKFYFNSPDSHSFAHLIGNSDSATGDRGKLHVTMHHNWYENGVIGRMPRVRFGYVHIYNNYYNSNNTNYCIGVGYECHVRLENSHFDNVDDPWSDYGGSSNGQMGWSNIKFEGSSQPTFISNSFPVFSPPYSFSLDSVDNVESIVKNGAGNR